MRVTLKPSQSILAICCHQTSISLYAFMSVQQQMLCNTHGGKTKIGRRKKSFSIQEVNIPNSF